MNKTDEYRLRQMLDVAERLMDVIADDHIDEQAILDDYHTQWLITTPLYNIGEQAYCVSREFKDRHPEVAWSSIAGMRHRLVHDDEGTNWSFVADAVLVEIPLLIEQVRAMLPTLDPDDAHK